MTKTDLHWEISSVAYQIEDFKAALRLETNTDKRKELNEMIGGLKKIYITLREKLDNGEYEEDEDDKYEIQRWLDHEEDARIAGAYAACSGSY